MYHYVTSSSCGIVPKQDFKKHNFMPGSDFTALEKYLFMTDKEVHLNIIKYLKGQISKVNLNVI